MVVSHFKDAVCWHFGYRLCLGHFVPSQGRWRKFFANYMNDPSGLHLSPTASVVNDSVTHEAASYKAAVMMGL